MKLKIRIRRFQEDRDTSLILYWLCSFLSDELNFTIPMSICDSYFSQQVKNKFIFGLSLLNFNSLKSYLSKFLHSYFNHYYNSFKHNLGQWKDILGKIYIVSNSQYLKSCIFNWKFTLKMLTSQIFKDEPYWYNLNCLIFPLLKLVTITDSVIFRLSIVTNDSPIPYINRYMLKSHHFVIILFYILSTFQTILYKLKLFS